MTSLIPKIDWDLPPRQLAWSVLEYEEGREITGLILLLLHVLKLRGYLTVNPERGTIDGGAGKSNSSGDGSRMGTSVMGAMFIFSVYLWIYHQPEMNARYKTEHCDGAFSSDNVASSDEL